MPETKLTPKQEAFVREYLVDLNATAAAERAGYGGGKAGAGVAGHRLLKVPKIAALIAEAQGKRAERTQVTADRVVQELAVVAFSDISKAFGPDGNLLPFKSMPPEARAALSGVDTEELFEGKGEERQQVGLGRKVRHWDKVRALELLMKHLGLLKDKVEMSGEGGKALSIHIDLGAGK